MEFRFARCGEYPQIRRFLDEYWARDHVYCRMPELFDWTFRRPGYSEPGSYTFAVAEEQGELTGILGGIPFRFNRFGSSSRGVWIVNYVIRPDHRRGAAALRLLSQFRRPEFDPVIAFGINPATSAIYRVLRGQVLDEIPRHFLVLPEACGRMQRLLLAAYPDWAAERAGALAEAFVLRRAARPAREAGDHIPASWDGKDWPAIAEQTAGAVRDSGYLDWRYRRHPVFEYRFLTVPDGARTGLAVWRLETIRRQTPGGRADFDRIGRLLEFLPASAAGAEALFNSFLDALRRADALGADFYGYHGQTRCWFRQLGFAEAASHPGGRAIPSRFQPLDGKGGGILSAIFVQSEAPACGNLPDCPWYWTKSDSDQDRPN